MNLKRDFITQLETSYPELKSQPLDNIVSENLISLFDVELPASVRDQAQEVISSVFSLREKQKYIQHYQSDLEALSIQDPLNKSMAMSYDFHVDESGQLKLIEINTNASFLLLGYEMYKMKNRPLPVSDFSTEEIREMILTELSLQKKNIQNPHVVITDEEPSQQRLFVEFLAYQELFKSFGWKADIVDYRKIFDSSSPDFIYNRYTDFFLSESSSGKLRQCFLDRSVCLSPNPFEYFLLADKQRLIDWGSKGFLESMDLEESQILAIRRMLPSSQELNSSNREEIWGQRKKLFFKPKRAFGSKQSFKGSSISRKIFDELPNSEIIAQEYVAAPERNFTTPEGPQNFKFDLRCYAYQGRLQLIVARLYQGQVTNLRTSYGGFGCVVFK